MYFSRTRSGAGGLVAAPSPVPPLVPLPPITSPLPLYPDDATPTAEPCEFVSLVLSVAPANADVASSEKAAARIIFFMMFIFPMRHGPFRAASLGNIGPAGLNLVDSVGQFIEIVSHRR